MVHINASEIWQYTVLIPPFFVGRVKLWDLRTELVPTSVVLPSDKSADVWSVAFGNDLNFWNKTFDFFLSLLPRLSTFSKLW